MLIYFLLGPRMQPVRGYRKFHDPREHGQGNGRSYGMPNHAIFAETRTY